MRYAPTVAAMPPIASATVPGCDANSQPIIAAYSTVAARPMDRRTGSRIICRIPPQTRGRHIHRSQPKLRLIPRQSRATLRSRRSVRHRDPSRRRRLTHEHYLARERADAHRGRRADHPTAVRPPKRSGLAWASLRLRPRAVRRLHGAHQGRGGALVHAARIGRARRRDHDTRRACRRRQAPSGAAGLDRRAGAAVRVLPERSDSHREGAPRPQSESERCGDSPGHAGCAVPLLHLLPGAGSRQACGQSDGRHADPAGPGSTVMTPTRRDFLKSSGALVVGFSALSMTPADAFTAGIDQASAGGPYPDLDFRQLDSWIVIRDDGTAAFHVGKTDLGQGTGTAFRQIMSDELDIAYEKTSVVMGSTDVTVDQGGSGGSDALQTDGWPMRRVAAEARRVLLELAATRFGVPVSALVVSKGVISVAADPSRQVTYGELVGGKRFNVTLTGNNIDATTGQAKLKTVQQLEMVGQSPQRYDIPPKVDGSLKWAVDVKLPGMLHARNVKPPVAGATLVSIDESSVKGIPGFVKVVSKGNYVAVVCEREEQAIRAARQLKVDWRKPATPPFPTSDELFTYMRSTVPSFADKPNVQGNPDAAFGSAAKVVEAQYDVPFQGHTSMGPAHAMADPSNDQLTIYSNDMKSYGLR